MSGRTRSATRWLRERVVLPFLLLAYPATFLYYQDPSVCGSVCAGGSTGQVVPLVGMLLALLTAVVVGARVLGLGERRPDRENARRHLAPAPVVAALLLGVYGAFFLILTLEARAPAGAGVYRTAMPFSFFFFLPVWALYVGTFLLAAALSVLGIDPVSGVPLLVWGVVVGLGFPLSVLFQSVGFSLVETGLRRAGETLRGVVIS